MKSCIQLTASYVVFSCLCVILVSGSAQWYPYTTSSGLSKQPKVIAVQTSVVLYDQEFNRFQVLPNGAVSFQANPVLTRKRFSLPKTSLLAPFLLLSTKHRHYQEFAVNVFHSKKILRKANNEIHQLFRAHRDFESTQVIVISWTHHKHLIHQTILISNGKQTFLQLIYKEKKGMMKKKAQAGISMGDGVRYTYFLQPKSKDNTDLLKRSNVGVPGKWAFYIGSTEGTVFQVHSPNTSPFVDNKSRFIIDNGLGCFRLTTTTSPFRVFHKESYLECRHFCKSIRQPLAMFQKERSCSCISRIYDILVKLPSRKCRLNHNYMIYSTAEFLSDEQSVTDFNECSTPNICSKNADCLNTRFGFQCKCKRGYFGNGKVCISNSSPARMFGKVSGNWNGRQLTDGDLSGIILVDRGVSYLTISSVDENIGYGIQLGATATDIVGWLFASKEEAQLKNALEIFGDRFKSKIVLKFGTGEEFTATHQMKGQDDFNYFVFDIQFSGRLPVIQAFVRPVFEGYSMQLQEVEDGVMEGESSASYSVEGKRYSYSIKATIEYDSQARITFDRRQVFSMLRQSSFYDSRQMLIRYQKQASVKLSDSLPPPIPKVTTASPSKVDSTPAIRSEATEQLVTEAPKTNPSTTSSPPEPPKTAPAPTTTTPPPTVPTKPPTTFAKCGNHVCHPNAQCLNFGGVFRCVCGTDYIGNGTQCRVDTRLRCGPNRCSEHSECIEENQRLFCVCKGGYVGDGITCEDEKECNCHPDATCFSNGQGLKYCLCDPGFQGDGSTCTDTNECKDNELICGPNAKCANTRGSYLCKCVKGFRKNGTDCQDIPECTEQSYVCHKTAKCLELPGSYKCTCPEGYRFNVDGRSCIVKCRRCLNGGKCIGKDRCLCKPGFTGLRCQWAGNEFLALGIGGTVKRISLPVTKTGRGSIYEKRGHLFVGVDYDCLEEKVYWTDLVEGTISRAFHNGSNPEVLIKGLVDPQGITIDWLGRNIFWTDTGSDRIGVSHLNGLFRKDSLISGELRNPRAIVCDPYQGKLYWTDWNRDRPRIEVASMDGSNRRVLVSTDLLLPNGLTIDDRTGKLCWTDAWYNTISCIGFDGRNRGIIYAEAKYPFGLAIHGPILYWTEWKTGLIARYNLDAKKILPGVRGSIGSDGKLYDIKVISPCQERKNVCSSSKCLYLCLMKEKDVSTCVCPDGPLSSFPKGACARGN